MLRFRIVTTSDIFEIDALDIINAIMIVNKTKGYLLPEIKLVEQI